MGLFRFRDKAIFRASVRQLDPDELRLRNRQRMVMVAALVGLTLLAEPVVQKGILVFQSDREARHLIQDFRSARLLAAETRSPVGVLFQNSGKVQVLSFVGQEGCTNPAIAQEKLSREVPDILWRPVYLESGNTSGTGVEINLVCFHPLQGVLVNGTPLAEGWIYVVLGPKAEMEQQNFQSSRQVVVSRFGQEFGHLALNSN